MNSQYNTNMSRDFKKCSHEQTSFDVFKIVETNNLIAIIHLKH